MKDKKSNLLLYVIIAVIVLIGAYLVYHFAFKADAYTNLVDINFKTFEEKINNKETFVLVVSQTGCSHCEQYLPELDRTLASYDVQANILNITNLSDEDSKNLSKYINFSGTPTTIFFTNGEEKTTLNRLVGYASRDKVIERLKALEFIN